MMDLKKLKAFAEGGNKGGGNPFQKRKGNQPPKAEEDDEDLEDEDKEESADAEGDNPDGAYAADDDEDSDDDADGEEAEEGSQEWFVEQIADRLDEIEMMLEQYGEELAHENPEPSPETQNKVRGAAQRLGGGLRKYIKQNIASFDEAQDLAERVAEERDVSDPDALAGWLYWAGKSV